MADIGTDVSKLIMKAEGFTEASRDIDKVAESLTGLGKAAASIGQIQKEINAVLELTESLRNLDKRFNAQLLIDYRENIYKIGLAWGKTDTSIKQVTESIVKLSEKINYNQKDVSKWMQTFTLSIGMGATSFDQQQQIITKLSQIGINAEQMGQMVATVERLSNISPDFIKRMLSGNISGADIAYLKTTDREGAILATMLQNNGLGGYNAADRGLGRDIGRAEQERTQRQIKEAEAMEGVIKASKKFETWMEEFVQKFPFLGIGRTALGVAGQAIGVAGNFAGTAMGAAAGTGGAAGMGALARGAASAGVGGIGAAAGFFATPPGWIVGAALLAVGSAFVAFKPMIDAALNKGKGEEAEKQAAIIFNKMRSGAGAYRAPGTGGGSGDIFAADQARQRTIANQALPWLQTQQIPFQTLMAQSESFNATELTRQRITQQMLPFKTQELKLAQENYQIALKMKDTDFGPKMLAEAANKLKGIVSEYSQMNMEAAKYRDTMESIAAAGFVPGTTKYIEVTSGSISKTKELALWQSATIQKNAQLMSDAWSGIEAAMIRSGAKQDEIDTKRAEHFGKVNEMFGTAAEMQTQQATKLNAIMGKAGEQYYREKQILEAQQGIMNTLPTQLGAVMNMRKTLLDYAISERDAMREQLMIIEASALGEQQKQAARVKYWQTEQEVASKTMELAGTLTDQIMGALDQITSVPDDIAELQPKMIEMGALAREQLGTLYGGLVAPTWKFGGVGEGAQGGMPMSVTPGYLAGRTTNQNAMLGQQESKLADEIAARVLNVKVTNGSPIVSRSGR